MGVEPFLISSAISGVMAQRLVRMICPLCREEHAPEEDQFAIFMAEGIDLTGKKLVRGRGCKNCGNSGYKGRTLIAEAICVDSAIRKLAIDCVSSDVIRVEAIRQGMETMRIDGLNKVLAGITTLDEVKKKVFLNVD